MSMGDDLLAILKSEQKQAEADRQAPLVDCPLCGEVLQRNSAGVANCPLGHYRTTAKTQGELG